MQWIVENQQLLLSLAGTALASGSLAGWWMKQTMTIRLRVVEEQLSHEQYLHQSCAQQLAQSRQELDELDDERDKAAHELKQSHGRLMAAMEKLRYLETVKQEKGQLTGQLEHTREMLADSEALRREQEARHEQEQIAAAEKLTLLENAEQRLKQQFEQLASQLFEVKTARVDQQNRQSLDGLLTPLKEQIEGFKKQVSDGFGQEAKERHTLMHEVRNLQKLNEQMAQEALNLTRALKGDNKQQGNWGEVVLARVLAESGLREGHEYHTQVSLQGEAGKRYQPDVVVELPGEKQVVVDSKMALVAYERYFHAEEESEREQALSEHLLAIRTHIKGLSNKDYHQLKGIRSLDYVLMFVPVEPAFQLAVQADPKLVNDALEHNIILVSPTTLLVALRTIDNLWRNERQNQNARLIAERAGKLYDKLRLYLTDMEALGGALDKANQNYQGAMNKLVTGRGNVLRQAESFKELGVEVKRPMPSSLLELAQNEQLTQRQAVEDKVD